MRKMISLILLCLLLTACGGSKPEHAVLPPPSTQPSPVSEPTGLYEPGSPLELESAGALRSYPLNMEAVYHMQAMGDHLLVFSGSQQTTLTSLTGNGLYVHGELSLPFLLSPGASTQATAKGLSYCDPESRELVLLDPALKEAQRIPLPQALIGAPILSPDRNTLYYCTSDAIRAMDLTTGIHRLVKQIAYPTLTMEKILLDGTVLQCGITDENGRLEHLFLDAATGQTLVRNRLDLAVTSDAGSWYATVKEGAVHSLIFSQDGSRQTQLYPADITAIGYYQPGSNSAVTISGTSMMYYDLGSGLCTAQITLPQGLNPRCVTGGKEGAIWFLAGTDSPSICRWDTAMTPCDDQTVYTDIRYTLKNPDTDALEACQAQAQALGQAYGVSILIGPEAGAIAAPGYITETEYSAPVILHALRQLETVLAWYPEGFFPQAMAGASDRTLTIGIVRSITGTPQSGDLGPAPGVQFWQNNRAYLLITPEQGLPGNFCHEMCHAMETLVFAESHLYDDWDQLNPEGFAYDFDYLANASRDGSPYLEGENRAFVDTHSMSFPKEDRATIMEFAMQPGNEAVFSSPVMQTKLHTLCMGIREAFRWEKSQEVFLWEQYLAQPLANAKES